jgi:hypothetical protein
MNPVLGICPICRDRLTVSKLHCRTCDTTLEGNFTLGRLYQLSAEQLQFVEVFVRCEGKIKRVEAELDMSYPTVRARLEDVITALGYDVGPAERPGVTDAERNAILARVSAGEITVEEAIELIERD